MFLVRVRTMVKNRIQALLAQHSVVQPEVSDLYGMEGMRWLKGIELPVPDGQLLSEDISLIEMIEERIRTTEGLIEDLSRGDEAVGWLKSLPGIGKFFSVLIRYEVDEIGRFRTSKKLAAYTGLVPST